MTGTIHRLLMTIGGIAAGVGGLFALPENSALGIPPQGGAILALIAGGCIIIANTIRANWPDVPVDTTKTTVEVKTGEQGDVNLGNSLGVFAFVVFVVFILWLAESAGKTNFFE